MDTELFLQVLEFQLRLQGLFYPGSAEGIVFRTVDTVNAIWPLLHNIFDNFIGLFSDLSQIIHILDFLPTSWITIISISLTGIVSLRIYSFFKDVEIGGFKV